MFGTVRTLFGSGKMVGLHKVKDDSENWRDPPNYTLKTQERYRSVEMVVKGYDTLYS